MFHLFPPPPILSPGKPPPHTPSGYNWTGCYGAGSILSLQIIWFAHVVFPPVHLPHNVLPCVCVACSYHWCALWTLVLTCNVLRLQFDLIQSGWLDKRGGQDGSKVVWVWCMCVFYSFGTFTNCPLDLPPFLPSSPPPSPSSPQGWKKRWCVLSGNTFRYYKGDHVSQLHHLIAPALHLVLRLATHLVVTCQYLDRCDGCN